MVCRTVGIKQHFMVEQGLNQFDEVTQAALVDDKAVEGIAHRDTTCLGIADNLLAHLQVTLLVEIGVDDACTSLDDGDAGGVTHEVDETTSATGNAEVYITHGIEHFARGLMSCWQQGDNVGIDAEVLEYLMDEFDAGLIGEVGIASTFQHAGIAALEAEREYVVGHVRTGLVDHADDAEGYADTMQAQTVGQRFLLGDVTKWRRQ